MPEMHMLLSEAGRLARLSFDIAVSSPAQEPEAVRPVNPGVIAGRATVVDRAV
jgi:hypothetical protein